ncbi:cytoplasmic protein [Enterobacteriaceae bacterium H4N4]|uniref:Cytoplasmic protein n=1 Tax=Silvania confinis TaxID=2926470 RepID=A0A9J6QFN8_9ENTR|nr:cytoplasmic protein [Silvania confinis]MCU6669572.1 cytoplasmic protein [Silvania confinis]
MNDVKEIDNNNVYLTLDDKKSDEFILEQNLEALKQIKNGELQRIAKELLSIPAGLVRLKWQNRREIYPLQIKEEIYGATINAIMEQRPELKEKILARLESNYQYLLARETATLRVTRKLAEEGYRTSSVTSVALDEEALVAKITPTPVKP